MFLLCVFMCVYVTSPLGNVHSFKKVVFVWEAVTKLKRAYLMTSLITPSHCSNCTVGPEGS